MTQLPEPAISDKASYMFPAPFSSPFFLPYDDLRDTNVQVARILVVLVMPEDEALWLSQSPEELVLRHCAYWLSLKGCPPTTNTTTLRVAIPLANVFSPAALRDIVLRLRERRDP